MRDPIFRTEITRMLDIRHPILCGGLGPGVSDGAYVAAVVNAGGMGFVVSSGYDAPDEFERQLAICRERVGGRGFGVNLYISRQAGGIERVTDLLPLLKRHGVTCVETAGASPEPIVPVLKGMDIRILHKVPAIRYVATAERVGADAVIVVGQECGGHPGVYMIGSMVQAAQAPRATALPTIVAGGFATGRQLVSALAMGNAAMLMGSRMMVAEELWIDRKIKDFAVRSDGSEGMVVKKIFRDNHRVLGNDSARAVLALEAEGNTDFDSYRPHVVGGVTREAYRSGDPSTGMIDWGQAMGFADRVASVESIFDEIIDDASAAMAHLGTVQAGKAVA
ncbi:NAD(P)H-dependent flavin oxidoreductase [Tropicimonas isoalkanivorans]|uniref:Nitronate monooxygenase n=1 Tax=Tropicimonas isoalkanivorans TaxID=441112 RepID=A0A1I1HS70_9RHOB|nr:nitronate monooxygenase [Tropicimonas isoalkanivorans]SFC26711.1 nitronate monooxygenase [Tropicimonas isoalkanivorans]